MVNGALSLGGVVGVLLSGAFLYFEIGRFAQPQVPRTLFDERRLLFAYTAGLFVGVPIAFALLLLLGAIANGALVSAIVDLILVAGAVEVAQWALVRSRYWGHGSSTPFYAVAFRIGLSAIFILAVVTQALESPTLDWTLLLQGAALSLALLALQAVGALQSLPKSTDYRGATGGTPHGLLLSTAALAFLSFGIELGPLTAAAAALLMTGGLIPLYRRLRHRLLERAAVPPGVAEPAEGQPPFGRTDRP